MNPADQHRISKQHLERDAIIYIRQSDHKQVRDHPESTRLQRGLRARAIAFGWLNPILIEDDLGITAAGFADRPGFQTTLTRVTMRKAGIIFCMEASRLSRNSKDWAHLFEMCGYFDTLIGDLQQVYDLAIPNDRLVLHIKGTVAELELSNMKTRLRMATEAKAARGELKMLLPAGYVYDSDGQIILDPDERVQQGIRSMFERFERATSLRQLAMSYRESNTPFPIKAGKDRAIVWEVPNADVLYKLITHPTFAGVYARGRTQSYVDCVDGKLVRRTKRIQCPEEWKVCIKDHHEAYISWAQFESNLAKLAEARPRWSMEDNRGAVREGLALLVGLLRCGQCGRRMRVEYKKKNALYYCDGSGPRGGRRCLLFGAKHIDQQVGEQLCCAVEPLAVEAAQEAFVIESQDYEQTIEQARLRVKAVQYAADRAFEQYDLADPKNRLVVDNLERRLNEKLAEVQAAQQQMEQCLAKDTRLTEQQRQELQTLARNFPSVWNHPETPVTLRKQLLRTAIREIAVTLRPDSQQLELMIHWEGKACTRLAVKKRATPVGSKTDSSLIEIVRELSQSLGDAEIARILNMKKLFTPQDLGWTQNRVQNFRAYHHIRQGKRAPNDGVLTCKQAHKYLGITRHALERLTERGVVHANQVTDFAPWQISRVELDSPEVQSLVRALKATGRLPKRGGSREAQTPLFPTKSSSL
jgi:DNA invertase Pin-like site-specific DNA recombinase